jgi:hypothetical protein
MARRYCRAVRDDQWEAEWLKYLWIGPFWCSDGFDATVPVFESCFVVFLKSVMFWNLADDG